MVFQNDGVTRGARHTEESRAKISAANTGVPKSEEQRKKMSESALGRTHTEESKQKIREYNLQEDVLKKNIESKQKEYIVTTPEGKEIKVVNLSDFCKENGLDRCAMYSVVSGKRGSHKGYKCRLKNPDELKTFTKK